MKDILVFLVMETVVRVDDQVTVLFLTDWEINPIEPVLKDLSNSSSLSTHLDLQLVHEFRHIIRLYRMASFH